MHKNLIKVLQFALPMLKTDNWFNIYSEFEILSTGIYYISKKKVKF